MRVVVGALALALSLSAVVGGLQVWRMLGHEHERWADTGSAAVVRAPAEVIGHPPEVFEFFAAHVRPDDRYYVHTGGRRLLSERSRILLLAQYLLLPAVIEIDPNDATVVLAYNADPSTLGLDYSGIERFPGAVYASVARVPR